MNLEIEKIKQSALYLAENIDNLYFTKFLKLLYYFDFISVLERGKPVTGDVYYHLPYGPVPSFVKDQVELLKKENKDAISSLLGEDAGISIFEDYIALSGDVGRNVLKKNEGIESRFEYLSDYEKKLLDDIIVQFKETPVREIVEKTHSEPPYLQTEQNNVIDYRLAFQLLRNNILPNRIYEFNPEVSQMEFYGN